MDTHGYDSLLLPCPCSSNILLIHMMDFVFLCCAQVTLVKMVNEATSSIPNWDSYAAGWAFTDLASQFSLPNVSMVVHDLAEHGSWVADNHGMQWYRGLPGYYRLLTFLPEFCWECLAQRRWFVSVRRILWRQKCMVTSLFHWSQECTYIGITCCRCYI
jgi:hypothetical protein